MRDHVASMGGWDAWSCPAWRYRNGMRVRKDGLGVARQGAGGRWPKYAPLDDSSHRGIEYTHFSSERKLYVLV